MQLCLSKMEERLRKAKIVKKKGDTRPRSSWKLNMLGKILLVYKFDDDTSKMPYHFVCVALYHEIYYKKVLDG